MNNKLLILSQRSPLLFLESISMHTFLDAPKSFGLISRKIVQVSDTDTTLIDLKSQNLMIYFFDFQIVSVTSIFIHIYINIYKIDSKKLKSIYLE